MSIYKAPTQNFLSTTLNGAINNSVQTITLTSTSGMQAPGYIIIDRQDGNGNNTPSAREVIKFTGISSNDLTGCTRGADNSTARAHSDGALVETAPTVGMWNELYSNFLTANATITSVGNISELISANATIATADVTGKLTVSGDIAGVGGQFFWSRTGSLATVQAGTATDTSFPLMRSTKNLTINSFYASVISAPSTSVFQFDVSHGSSPTGDFASIFSTNPTIDVGEYDTSTAATAAVLSLTSLASGSLLRGEIDKPGDAGTLSAVLQVTSR